MYDKAFLPSTRSDPYRTFLKRKGGLFKKAHELSVLCSVDVAVIIFGHNKKLYEFSSGDITETLTRYSYVCHPTWDVT
jgi:transcription factor RLM1